VFLALSVLSLITSAVQNNRNITLAMIENTMIPRFRCFRHASVVCAYESTVPELVSICQTSGNFPTLSNQLESYVWSVIGVSQHQDNPQARHNGHEGRPDERHLRKALVTRAHATLGRSRSTPALRAV
jgi:hypothetical protein